MFSNIDDNYNMLLGSYKKIKSYYYYNKNFLFMKKKIAEFEDDESSMHTTLRLLANIMAHPHKYDDKICDWISKIDYYVLPKAFKEESEQNDKFISNTTQTNKPICKVNLFIDMPFELHLLETVWTLFVGKIVFDNHIVDNSCYGNVLDNRVVFNNEDELKDSINFQKNKLFKIYFGQYCNWKNNAIETINNNKKNKSMIMVSLDIMSYYYSVVWKFDILYEIINDSRLELLDNLTDIIEKIFYKYTNLVSEVRDISQDVNRNEYVLPIGLFCSMVLANIYLSRFDKQMTSLGNVLYYGRYVDDMLIVMDVTGEKFKCTDEDLDKILTSENNILKKIEKNIYSLPGYKELLIQKDKLKVIHFECSKSDSLIKQLKKTEIIPSQMNVVPDNDLKMTDFEESAYMIQNFTTETKIRDFGQLKINSFKLAWHMAELVRQSKYKQKHLSTEEKGDRQTEGKQVLSFFQGSNALEYNNNWINALYFFLMTHDTNRNAWKQFESNVRTSIRELRIIQPEAIKKGKTNTLKSKMKKQLLEQFNICIATALAINPNFYKKESQEVRDLAYKLRRTNLFNHYLVAYPLINYVDSIDANIDLSSITIEQLSYINFKISESKKIQFSPRFINLDELFQFAFLESISHTNIWHLTQERMEFIRDVFYSINNIDVNYAKPLQIEIGNEGRFGNYHVQNINLTGREVDLEKVKIAVANIKLGIKDCFLGVDRKVIIRNRTNFIRFLRETYENGKVNYLIFPEFYLPIQWISDVLSYVRKSGITIITGLQYVARDGIAHNTIGIFTQITSGKYNSSCMIVREKNDYAPFEKELLALKGFRCMDKEMPLYSIVNCNGVRFGTFLCYEFTDILARGLYKDKADILFIPENNKDTTYFSNIIETTSRDLHTFVVQSNTSIYGDSRITGPYSRDQRNIVQIKGGDNDTLIIGTINIKAVKDYRKGERNHLEKNIKDYLAMDSHKKYKKEKELITKQEIKISKTSARTKY